jgi:putative membrane protein
MLLLLAPFLLMGMTCTGMMGQAGPMGPMMGSGWLMLLFWLLVVIGVILLVTWAVRRLASQETGAGAEAPLDILQRRYARGEIGREEYERVRGDLLSDRGTR